MIPPLLRMIPAQLWLPLGLAALAPLLLLVVVAPLSRRRARGIATILTLQTVVVLSLGFAVLAAVATISLVQTGFRELRERHAPVIRTLARELEQLPLGSGGANAKIALTLFRARYPSVALVALGTDHCRGDCVIARDVDASADDNLKTRLAEIWPPDATGEALAPVDGSSLLVVVEPLRRDGASGRQASVIVGIRADTLADQATFTAWVLLSIGYVLLFVVGIISWRQLDRSLGARIAAITRQVRAAEHGLEDGEPLRINGNELSELAAVVSSYIERTVAKQRSTDERYRRLVELAPDGILMCTNMAIKFANSAALVMAGIKSRYEVIGQPIEKFLEFESMRAHDVPGSLRPAKWRRVDGSMLHVEVAEITDNVLRDETRQFMIRDVTDRRVRDAALAHRAEHDALTGLVNRARFENRLVDLLDARQRTPVADRSRDVAVLFIDLDGFKPVNDQYGHAAGDAVLVAVAARLRESTRGTDVIARLGGDEFAVLADMQDHGEASAVAERILQALTRPVLFDGKELTVGASIGIADSRFATPSDPSAMPTDTTIVAAELLRAADAAMYAAKALGGRRYDGVARSPQSLPDASAVNFRDVA